MLLGSTAYAEEVQPESGQQAQTELDSYFRFPFRNLREEDRLKLPDGMSEVALSVPKNSNGLLFTGTVDALQSGKKGTATIRKAKTAKWISKKQRRGKRWYFKVRPYTRIGNKIYYGKWSNIVKKKVP